MQLVAINKDSRFITIHVCMYVYTYISYLKIFSTPNTENNIDNNRFSLLGHQDTVGPLSQKN